MKKLKICSLLLVISLISSVFGSLPAFAANLNLPNGDFESGIDYLLPFPNWGLSGSTITRAKEGNNHYACIKTDSGAYLAPSNSVNLQPGDYLTLTFDLRIIELDEGADASVYLAFKDKDGKTIEKKIAYSYYEHRGEWKTYTINHLVPDNAYGVNFLFRVEWGGGEVHYDNIKVSNSKSETWLQVTYGDLELDSVPDGVQHLKAKLHYVSESSASESGNLIFAAYSGEDVVALDIMPFTTSKTTYKEATLELPDNAKDISVKAYVWKNGQTLEPIAESVLLPRNGMSKAYDRLVTERMRGAYGSNVVLYQDEDGNGKYEVMDKLLDAGINTFIFQIQKDRNGTLVDKDFRALENALNDLSEFSEETGSMIFAKFNYGTDAVIDRGKYGYYHKGNNTTILNPCPLAVGYWEEVMQARMEIAARTPNIMGVVFDMEMYSSGVTRFSTPCFCENCVNKFVASQVSDKATSLKGTPITSRLEFAKVNNIYTDYKNWQAGEITKIVSGIREHLHQINPNLILGMMPNYDWLNGFEEGLGTEEMPAIVFVENSYGGNVATCPKIAATMRTDGANTLIATGLYPREDGSHISVNDFAGKVAEAGSFEVGYWIYEIAYLENDFTLNNGESYRDYYPALTEGNELLDTTLGIN